MGTYHNEAYGVCFTESADDLKLSNLNDLSGLAFARMLQMNYEFQLESLLVSNEKEFAEVIQLDFFLLKC